MNMDDNWTELAKKVSCEILDYLLFLRIEIRSIIMLLNI